MIPLRCKFLPILTKCANIYGAHYTYHLSTVTIVFWQNWHESIASGMQFYYIIIIIIIDINNIINIVIRCVARKTERKGNIQWKSDRLS